MEFENYTLVGSAGEQWNFRVFPHRKHEVSVQVRGHPQMGHGKTLTLLRYVSFSNDLLKQMPKAIIEEEFARARLFRNKYSWVRDFSDSDYARNATVIGIRMEFPVPHYTVELEREDARRLWGHLAPRRRSP